MHIWEWFCYVDFWKWRPTLHKFQPVSASSLLDHGLSSNFHERFPKWGEEGKTVSQHKKLQFDKIPALFDNKHAVKAQLLFQTVLIEKSINKKD